MKQKMEKKTKRKSNKFFVVLAVALSVLVLAVWIPTLMGLKSFYVQTDSMAPAIPKGSMAYIEPVASIDDIVFGADVLLFSNQAQTKSFMHRAMSVDYETQKIYTKGDANEQIDLLPTSFSMCRGRVAFSVPYWGYAAQAFNSVWGKAAIVLAYAVCLAVAIENIKSKKKAVKT